MALVDDLLQDKFGDVVSPASKSKSETEAVYPAPNSCVANLNKQLRELETRYHRTRLTSEKVGQKV
jgi:hypothetical protein